MTTLSLSWPPKALSPNARVHWSAKAKAAKAYRWEAYAAAKAAGLLLPAGLAILHLEFCPPDRRRRDDDNLIASCKALRDGIAEALGMDDSLFTTKVTMSPDPVKGGVVKVSIEEAV